MDQMFRGTNHVVKSEPGPGCSFFRRAGVVIFADFVRKLITCEIAVEMIKCKRLLALITLALRNRWRAR